MITGTPVSPDLIESAVRGGTVEADNLIRVVWPRAYRIAFSVVRSHTLAEDAAQEACAILFRSIRQLRAVEAFPVWFYRIVIRQAVGVEKRNREVILCLPQETQTELDESLTRIDVANALASLTRMQRITIALHYHAEMNSREIAEVLGIADSSVRFHIMRGRHALQKALAESNSGRYKESPYGVA